MTSHDQSGPGEQAARKPSRETNPAAPGVPVDPYRSDVVTAAASSSTAGGASGAGGGGAGTPGHPDAAEEGTEGA